MPDFPSDFPSDVLPPDFWHGLVQFNQQQFYACHDTLEAIWLEAVDPERNFYQGILQIAVALYHLDNHNWQGAVTLLGEGLHRLSRYPNDYANLDLDRFRDECHTLLQHLQPLDPTTVASWLPQWQAEHSYPRLVSISSIQSLDTQ
ncbi:DUF309 domain-containing protein [Trichothermofontia sp.]